MVKDFKGHIEPDDPRNPLWGAGGCHWPTIPPARIRIGAPYHGALWSFLNTTGWLFDESPPQQHDDVTWDSASATPFWISGGFLWRHWDVDAEVLWWTLIIDNITPVDPMQITMQTPGYDVGNKTIVMPTDQRNFVFPDPPPELYLYQVYYNETMPPEDWPPWE